MKRLLVIALVLLWTATASSYDIQITTNIPLTEEISDISINPVTGIAAAVSKETKTLFLIDIKTNVVTKKIPLDIIPSGVAVDTAKNLAIVSSIDGNLQYIDLESGGLVETISTGRTIHSIAINKENNTLFIGNGNSLMVMDLETENIIKEASLSNAIIGMDIDNNLGYLLITTEGKNGLFLYNVDALELLAEITPTHPTLAKGGEGGFPNVAVNPSTHIAVLTNETDDSISIIALEDKTLLETIPFYEHPNAITIDPTRNIALITLKDSIAIIKLENPVPRIDTLIPESSMAGDSGFTLSIKGSKFIRDSRARFNLKEMNTSFEDNYNLKALIPSEELLSPGYVPVSIMNPPPGGGESNSLIFRIINPIPQIESIKPDTAALQGPPVDIRVRGINFLPNSIVNLNGRSLETKFISSILLEARADLKGIETPARYPVTVINPTPVSFTSNVVFLNVVEDESLIASPQKEGDEQEKEKTDKPTGALTGRILNTQKEPIEGVTVQIKNIKVVTDSNGYFTLENVP